MKLSKIITSLALVATLSTAQAQNTIELVVPIAPGGGGDTLARVIADVMTKNGITTSVVNRTGAERSIGANYVATAKPDGSVLFFGAISDTVLLPLYKYPGLKFNDKTFIPISYLASIPLVITAKKDFPADTPQQFLSLIGSNPHLYPIGTFGKLAEIHAYGIFGLAGVKPTTVKYKGDVPVVTDLVGGHLGLGINSIPPVKKLILNGEIKAIAMLNDKRDPDLPNLPTLKEIKGYNGFSWFGVFAPPGTPDDVVKKLHQAFNQTLNDPIVQKQLTKMSYGLKPMSQQEFAKFYRDEVESYRPIVDKILKSTSK